MKTKIETTEISRDLIVTGINDRRKFNEGKVRLLADSISRDGIGQPPIVRPVQINEELKYQIVSGERRFRAMTSLGWEDIPVRIMNLTDEQAASYMLSENTARESLTPIEESDAYQRRIDEFNLSIEEVAEIAGVSKSHVQQYLQFQNLSEYTKGLVECGTIAPKYAIALTKLDTNRQYFAVQVYKNKPNMAMRIWAEVCNKFHSEQVKEQGLQRDFFGLVNEQIEFVDQSANVKSSGKDAITGVPCFLDIPLPDMPQKHTAAEIIATYITYLNNDGKINEAKVVSNLYNILVERRLISLPVSYIPLGQTTNTVGQEMDKARNLRQTLDQAKQLASTLTEYKP